MVDMNLKHMECFVALAETLNFTEAAASVFVTQPSFSRYISGMEEKSGIVLFSKNSMVGAPRQIIYIDLENCEPYIQTLVWKKNNENPCLPLFIEECTRLLNRGNASVSE
jgi:hypothetical protein